MSAPNLRLESDALWQWSIDDMKSRVADRKIAAGDKSRDWALSKRQIEQDYIREMSTAGHLPGVCTKQRP